MMHHLTHKLPDHYRRELTQFTSTDAEHDALVALVERITAEKTAALSQENEQAQLYIDEAAAMLIGLDAEGIINFVNDRACQILEYGREELIGENWFDLCVPQDTQVAARARFVQVREGEVEALTSLDEHPIIAKSGQRRIINWHNKYEYDSETGAIISSFSWGEDVTIQREMQVTLYKNDLRFRQMFYRNSAIKLVLHPQTGRIIDANTAACEFYGYSYDKLTQMDIGQINTKPLAELLGDTSLGIQERRQYIFQHRLASGEIRDVEVHTGPMLLDDLDLRYSVVLDITEREQAKRDLQLRESQFRTAISHFPNGMMIMFDTDLQCIIANGQLLPDDIESLLDLEGKYLPDVLPDSIWRNVKAHYSNVLEGQSQAHDFEHDKRHFLVQIEPLYDEQEVVVGGLHILQDITYIRRSERLLQDTKEQINTILDGIVDGVAIVSKDEEIMYANDTVAHILGFESSKIMIEAMEDGLYILNVPLDEQGQFLEFKDQALFRALKGETPPPQTVIFRNPDNEQEILTETKAKPIFDDNGDVRFAVIIVQDITRARQMEQFKIDALQEQAQIETLRKYIANTTHDLSQPLSVINTAIYMLDKTVQDKRVQKRTRSIMAQSLRMQSILRDIRQMSTLDSVGNLKFSQVDLTQLTGQIAEYHETRLAETDITFHYEISSSRKFILGNAEYIERAITQLIQNAINYSRPDGEIHFNCYEQSGSVIVEIQDNGVGIDAVYLDQIFDRFYRIDKSRTSTPRSGTGLGLAISKRIMELHGGSIHVESEVGQGSVFRLLFPVQLSD